MEAVNVPKWYIGSCQKIKYLFPKAHAAAYVTTAIRIAWFKIFKPLAFYAATFSVRGGLDGTIAAGGRDRVEEVLADIRAKGEIKEASARDEELYTALELAREMLLRGFAFAPVSLEKSSPDRFLVEEGKLRLPFNALPGLGLAAAQSIAGGRAEKPYRSMEDLRRRGKVGKVLLESLQQQGALEGLPESDQQTIF
jgi:DNA polymerase-3 subunit alpha (Gram-positive type)